MKEFRALQWAAGAALATLSAGPALAQADPHTAQVEDVVVTGRRTSEATLAIGTDQVSNTISITREALLSAPAGVSGLKMLEGLPGFNVQANDALGLYEFGNSVSVRAFNFQQIGFVLDGAPTGRSDQFGGSPIFRYVENENLARVTASQGAGDVAQPSYSSLGPIVQYVTIDPAETFGVATTLTTGSDNLKRGFLRVDTGKHGGASAYISYSDFSADLWRGPGDLNRKHAEGKLRYQASNCAEAVFGVVWNDYFDYDAPAITKAQYAGAAGDAFGRSGRDFAYLGHVPVLPQTTTGVVYSNPLYNQYYKQAVNSRTDTLYRLSGALPLGQNFRLEGTAYYEDKEGYGVSPEAYAASLTSYNNQRLILPGLAAPRGLQYGLSTVDGERKGLVARAIWEVGRHSLTGGVWIETDDYHRTQTRYNQADGSPDGDPLLNEAVHRQRDFVSTRETRQLFLQDVIHLLDDRLKIELGVKALDIDYQISGYRNPADYINQRQPSISDNWKDGFLPNIGLTWNISRTEQIFTSYAENLALPRGADDVFALASPAARTPDAEISKNWELGVRTNRPSFNAALALYKTTFDNRLQSYAVTIPGSGTTENFFQNVGAVEAHGAEFSGVWKPEWTGGKAYFNANASYNIVEFKDDLPGFTPGTGAALTISGNTVPDSPEWIIQGGVTIEPTSWIVANVSARHIGERFSNFTNTERTRAYTVVNAYVDFGGGWSAGPLKELGLRLNVDNLLDEDYLGAITTTVNTPATFRPGPPRTVQVSLTAAF
ncbi:TonB-dependent receptor domain-containing protein [Brevundimonas diminuta]|uniref:TonB-dependent receptor domain-containing protein n=1 Tax=Brevundimonas diminuta TaxID=293 RepID=UPI003D0440E7